MKEIATYRHDMEILLKTLVQHLTVSQCAFVAMAICLLLTACSEDPESKSGNREHFSFQMVPSMQNMQDMQDMQNMQTRAWVQPSGYLMYSDIYGDHGLFANQKNMVNKSVEVFFTRNDAFIEGKNYQEGTFSYSKRDDSWRLNMELEGGVYYLYGFIPKEVASSAVITPFPSFSSGATLTINGLSPVTPSDVCVIVGAKDGPDADHDKYADDANDKGIKTGQFKINAKTVKQATGESEAVEGENYIFLLFDHLYSALRFNFTVDDTYDALRTIKLRGLQLKACTDNSYDTGISLSYDATISLSSNTTGQSPVGSVTFSPTSNASAIDYIDLYEWDGVENTDEDKSHEVILEHGKQTGFMGCFVPGSSYYFQLKSTYDVFDKQGNLIRKNCQAVNSFDLRNVFGKVDVPQRGNMYSLTVKVQPTYLYMLSEPDLNNPTVKVER